MRFPWISSLALGAGFVAGCASPTEEHLLAAAEALDDCDLRAAHEHFDAANAGDSGHPDAALGFALTDTVLLPEDPEVTAALAELGFTAPLDSELVLFGPDALLARLRRGESCRSVGDFLSTAIPYPPLRGSGVDGRELIASDLDAQGLVDRLTALDGRLERIARAFETAANAMEGREVTIDGGCGMGRMVVQAPELYAAAAAFVLVRAGLAIAPAYDWSFSVRDLVSVDVQARAAALSSLLALRDGARAEDGRALLVRGLGLALRGVRAAESVRSSQPDAAFDWTAMNRIVLADLALMLERAIASFEERGPETIPFMTPAVSIDLSAYLSAPLDSSGLTTPLWTAEQSSFDPDYYYLNSHGESWEALLAPTFSPSPWEARVSWDIFDRWRGTDLGAVFDPGDRYESAYMCTR